MEKTYFVAAMYIGHNYRQDIIFLISSVSSFSFLYLIWQASVLHTKVLLSSRLAYSILNDTLVFFFNINNILLSTDIKIHSKARNELIYIVTN